MSVDVSNVTNPAPVASDEAVGTRASESGSSDTGIKAGDKYAPVDDGSKKHLLATGDKLVSRQFNSQKTVDGKPKKVIKEQSIVVTIPEKSKVEPTAVVASVESCDVPEIDAGLSAPADETSDETYYDNSGDYEPFYIGRSYISGGTTYSPANDPCSYSEPEFTQPVRYVEVPVLNINVYDCNIEGGYVEITHPDGRVERRQLKKDPHNRFQIKGVKPGGDYKVKLVAGKKGGDVDNMRAEVTTGTVKKSSKGKSKA